MYDRYQSPLSERYASREMQYIFSPEKKFRTWRKLWIALAETEKELGLPITQEQIDELKAHKDDINFDVAKEREKLVRHDVMSHVYAYGLQCPNAKGIIHLGATSCYVGDNTDIILMTEALKLVRKKLVNVMAELASFAEKYKDQPTLAFTHFQPAQRGQSNGESPCRPGSHRTRRCSPRSGRGCQQRSYGSLCRPGQRGVPAVYLPIFEPFQCGQAGR